MWAPFARMRAINRDSISLADPYCHPGGDLRHDLPMSSAMLSTGSTLPLSVVSLTMLLFSLPTRSVVGDRASPGRLVVRSMRVDVSAEAAAFVRAHGGRLWVWAARPRRCCQGTPAYMHAATEPPPDLSAFHPVPADGLEVCFRASAGRFPDVLEIGLRGRRRPRVEAYWDGCLIAL